MKILYGVQGTGNGHITRARAMARELYAAGLEVNFLFSGRPADKYFDMDVFKDYQLNVAKILVEWLQQGMPEIDKRFIQSVWAMVDASRINLNCQETEIITSHYRNISCLG